MYSVILALVALPAVLAQCNDNNCARAITGTRSGKLPIESRKADCSSFQTTTVYATPTATVTPPVLYNRNVKRDPVTVTHTVPAYATQCDLDPVQYASVCSCWNITSGRTTVTTPTTTTVLPVPTCKRGLEFAYYELERGTGQGKIPSSSGSGYQSVFSVESVKGIIPAFTNRSFQISFSSPPPCDHFSVPTIDGTPYPGRAQDISALAHRGYVYADVVGTYTVEFTSDDLVLFWYGANATSGWTVGNANGLSQYGDNTPGTASFSAVAGQYIPIRVLYVNAQGCSGLTFSLKKPGGAVIFSSEGPTPGNAVVASCAGAGVGALAPAFPAWQSEV